MAISRSRGQLKKDVTKEKKKLEGRFGLSSVSDELYTCAKEMASQAENMSMSDAVKVCRSMKNKFKGKGTKN